MGIFYNSELNSKYEYDPVLEAMGFLYEQQFASNIILNEMTLKDADNALAKFYSICIDKLRQVIVKVKEIYGKIVAEIKRFLKDNVGILHAIRKTPVLNTDYFDFNGYNFYDRNYRVSLDAAEERAKSYMRTSFNLIVMNKCDSIDFDKELSKIRSELFDDPNIKLQNIPSYIKKCCLGEKTIFKVNDEIIRKSIALLEDKNVEKTSMKECRDTMITGTTAFMATCKTLSTDIASRIQLSDKQKQLLRDSTKFCMSVNSIMFIIYSAMIKCETTKYRQSRAIMYKVLARSKDLNKGKDNNTQLATV